VDETVLRRTIGDAQVMREQLRHLVGQTALPSVCFQVVPASVGAHEGLNGSFSVLEFADPDEPGIVYLENAVNTGHVHKEVEVAGVPDRVAMRDSKNPDGPVLTVPRGQWRALLSDLRVDQFR
jgi:hypothetical protein